MLKIRLKRTGRRNAPSYRIVVADARSPRDGKVVEEIGWYNPTEDPNRIVYDKDRFSHWLKCGAQPTEAVGKLVKGDYTYVPYAGSDAASEVAAAEQGEEAPQAEDSEQEEGKGKGAKETQ